MKKFYLPFLVLVLCVSSFAEAQDSRPTTAQLGLFRHMLMIIGSLDYSPDAVEMYESGLDRQFGLNQDEANMIHEAGLTLRVKLKQFREASSAITKGKTTLSPDDLRALATIDLQQKEQIAILGAQILKSVRPEVEIRLRFASEFVASATGEGTN